MSKIGDKLRVLADEFDAIDRLTGVIFAASGDLEINLACADPGTPPLDTMRRLVAAAQNAMIGTLKAAFPDETVHIGSTLN